MKTLRYERYGAPDVIGLADAPEPQAGRGEVVVAVSALALNPKDVLARKGWFDRFPGVRLPIVPCHDLAGTVLAAGPGADLAIGTEVYGWYEGFTGGAGSERVAITARWLAAKPPSLSWAEAASLPLAALTALQALRDELRIQPGERLVINGASGGVGVFAIQIGRILGAHVIAVSSGRNRGLCLGLGAHEHVDYAAQDILERRDVDAFFDVFGNKPWAAARATLTASGRYCTTLPRLATAARGLLARLGLHRAHLVVVRSRRPDLDQLSAWVASGELVPVIDRVLPWDHIAEAHTYLETKRARGKVVLELPVLVSPDAP